MNWDIVSDYYPLYQEAFLLTMFIAFWGILGSIAVGFLVSLIRFYKIPILKSLATAYIEFSRNTPVAAAFLSLLRPASCWTRSIL